MRAARFLLLGLAALPGCRNDRAASPTASTGTAPASSAIAPGEALASPPASGITAGSATGPTRASAAGQAPPAPTGSQKFPGSGARAGDLLVDPLHDVGPAAPATASDRGVVLATRSGELVLVRLETPLRPRGKPPGLAPVDRPAEVFAPRSRGPAVLEDFAYLAREGRLERRSLRDGSSTVLATDARAGARVAAARVGGAAVVAYVGSGTEELGVSLWAEGEGVKAATADGASVHSVALAPTPEGALLLYLDARLGMSQLHARAVTRDGTLRLGEDVVVWVGGAAHSTSEVVALGAPARELAFLAFEESAAHFGLVRLRLSSPPRAEATATWLRYPNGLAPAPVAAAAPCGRPRVAFVRPVDATRGAPQEIVLADADEAALGPGRVVASARAVLDLSFAAVPGGALLVWNAEGRTWALTLRCPA